MCDKPSTAGDDEPEAAPALRLEVVRAADVNDARSFGGERSFAPIDFGECPGARHARRAKGVGQRRRFGQRRFGQRPAVQLEPTQLGYRNSKVRVGVDPFVHSWKQLDDVAGNTPDNHARARIVVRVRRRCAGGVFGECDLPALRVVEGRADDRAQVQVNIEVRDVATLPVVARRRAGYQLRLKYQPDDDDLAFKRGDVERQFFLLNAGVVENGRVVEVVVNDAAQRLSDKPRV